ncbi:MAG: hypothetical protein ABIH17_04905, partial [Pseudomonadota bacterium]
ARKYRDSDSRLRPAMSSHLDTCSAYAAHGASNTAPFSGKTCPLTAQSVAFLHRNKSNDTIHGYLR